MKTKKVKLNIELVLNLQSTVNKIYIWRFRSIHLLIGKTLKSRIYSKFVRFIHSFQSCMNAEEQNMNLRALRSETKSVCEQYFRCLKQKKKKKKKTKYEANKSIGLWGGRKLKLDYTLPSVCLLCHKEERGCCCRYSVVPSSPKTVNRTAMIIMSYWFTISHEHTMYAMRYTSTDQSGRFVNMENIVVHIQIVRHQTCVISIHSLPQIACEW